MEDNKQLYSDTVRLFNKTVEDQFLGDIVKYRINTNAIASEIDALVERIAHQHRFKRVSLPPNGKPQIGDGR